MEKLALVLAVLVGLSFSQYYDVNFPAVSGNQGVIVSSRMSCDPGGDRVNLGLPPSFDKATVDSIINAYYLASEAANSSCESSVQFGSEEQSIEGPSGGLQFHLFYYQMLIGMEYRTDVMATGQVDEEGNVMPVGGEEEKAEIAKEKGYRYFITKPASVYDYYILMRMNSSDFRVILVNNASDAREFIRKDKSPEFNISYLIATPKEINESSPYDSEWLGKYYGWMHDEYKQEIAKLDNGVLKDEYQKAYDKGLALEGKGYHYSSANYMFVNLASIEALNMMKEGKMADRAEVDECISGFRNFVPSYGTYEIYSGAASRIERANEFEPSGEANISSVYFSNSYVLTESLLWCKLAKELAKDSEKGNDVDTSVLRNLLQGYLYNFSNKGDDVDRARRLFIKDEYLGSYYELSYYISSQDKNATMKESYDTKWGNAFAAHAYYINTTNGSNPQASIALANYLDAMHSLVIRNGSESRGAPQSDANAESSGLSQESQYGLIILLIIVVLALMFIIYRVIKQKNRGKEYGSRKKND
jgi:hypothetical protein